MPDCRLKDSKWCYVCTGRTGTPTPTSSCEWHVVIETALSVLNLKTLCPPEINTTYIHAQPGLVTGQQNWESCSVSQLQQSALWKKWCHPCSLFGLSITEVIWAGFTQWTRNTISPVFTSWANTYKNTPAFFTDRCLRWERFPKQFFLVVAALQSALF